MISQGFIIKEDKVLMVKQYVQRGAIVWNFPGGGIEEGESPEQTCEREVKEETGYNVKVKELLYNKANKFTYIVEIIGGEMFLNNKLEDNKDILDVAWISINDKGKWDNFTLPILNVYKKSLK
jgi:8-oxo-dGTP diphosphatase